VGRNISAGPGWRVLGHMALVALVIGTSLTASATERVTLSLVMAGAIGWSFVPLLQLLTGLFLIRGAEPGRRLALLDRYFATGWPWALWILVVHGTFVLWPWSRRFGHYELAIAALVPILWTIKLLIEYCQRELHLDAHRARIRVVQHQALTYSLFAAYVFFAVSLWPRVVGFFA
jgi:hypothetical protein